MSDGAAMLPVPLAVRPANQETQQLRRAEAQRQAVQLELDAAQQAEATATARLRRLRALGADALAPRLVRDAAAAWGRDLRRRQHAVADLSRAVLVPGWSLTADARQAYERLGQELERLFRAGSLRMLVGAFPAGMVDWDAPPASTEGAAASWHAVCANWPPHDVPVHGGGVVGVFPDLLVVQQPGRQALACALGKTSLQFQECLIKVDAAPPGADVAWMTWRHADSEGWPDWRQPGNRQVPVVRGVALELVTDLAVTIRLLALQVDNLTGLAGAWSRLLDLQDDDAAIRRMPPADDMVDGPPAVLPGGGMARASAALAVLAFGGLCTWGAREWLESRPPRMEPRVEAPRVEAPRVEAPRVEAPRVDAPRVELAAPPVDPSPVATSAVVTPPVLPVPDTRVEQPPSPPVPTPAAAPLRPEPSLADKPAQGSPTPAPSAPASAGPTNPEDAERRAVASVVVRGTGANLRANPGGAVVLVAAQGSVLDVLSQRGGWFEVMTPEGPAWVHQSIVDLRNP